MNSQLLFNFGWLAYRGYSLYVSTRYPIIRRRRRRKRRRLKQQQIQVIPYKTANKNRECRSVQNWAAFSGRRPYGYYSDVCIALTQKGRYALKEFLKAQGRSAKARELRRFLNSAKFHRTDAKSKAEVWLWKNIKWYENDEHFPEVLLLARLLRELPLDEYRFMRLGEYSDDVEEQGNFWDTPFDMHFAREISVT